LTWGIPLVKHLSMAVAAENSLDIVHFAGLLKAGGLVAFPTETVYGLGADATNSEAVLGIYETKGRPRFNPLIVHCADLAMAETLVEFSPIARRLARFWPGPLTLVLPKKPAAPLSDLVTAGLDTVGVRVPAHPLALALIRAAGTPLAGPSANPSGKLSPTTAEQVRKGFHGRVPVLDGGPCTAGVESTILAVAGDAVTQLRAGALPRAEIEAAIGQPIAIASENAAVAAPGMLASHYAPNARLRLDAAAPRPGEAYLAFGPEPADGAEPLRNLSPAGDLREAARNLFAMLHELDLLAAGIAVAPIPHTGLGEAINDRLKRAAAPRS
jgi:L-threonylcarbamoyladenylate synthase